jgi:hypothetical protein
MAATLYLAGSIFILLVALTHLVPGAPDRPLVPVYFFTGWLAGELALQVVRSASVVTLVFAALGAFAEPRGWSGSRCRVAAWGLLLASHFRAQGASGESTRSRARPGSRSITATSRATHGF